MIRNIRRKKTSQTAVVTGSTPNKWGLSEQHKMWNQQHFTRKMREYPKDKINELATFDKNKNIGDM
jgi:hypothetical protein